MSPNTSSQNGSAPRTPRDQGRYRDGLLGPAPRGAAAAAERRPPGESLSGKGQTGHPSSYRPDIDGLRAVAVLSVVLCHLKLFLQGGYVGVDVFFVISGFLITRIIFSDLAEGRFSPVEFWERRVRRLLPALVAMSLATVVAGWFFLMPVTYANFGKALAALWTMSANIYFWQDTGYFTAANQDKPLLHTWSLAVEEQFYLVLPLLLLLLARREQLKRAPVVLGAIAAVTLGLAIHTARTDANSAFYLIHFRAWELLAGSLLALLAENLTRPHPSVRDALSLAGLALILAPCWIYTNTTPFPGLAAVPPVLGAGLLVWGGCGPGPLPLVNRWLSWRPMVAIGLWSYSIYLWHWPLSSWLRAYTIQAPDGFQRTALVPVVLAVGYLSYRWIETPFRRRSLLPARASLRLTAAAAVALLLGTASLISASGGFLGRMPADLKPVDRREIVAPAYRAAFIEPEQVPGGMRSYGAPGARPEVLVWGDSHAACWLPGVEAVCVERGTRALAAVRKDTPPVWDDPDPLKRRFNEAVVQYLRSSSIRRVILAGRWGHFGSVVRKLPLAVDQLRQAGCEVYVVGDVPDYPFEVPWGLAMARFWNRDPAVVGLTLSQYRAKNAVYLAAVPEMKRLGAHILDPLPALQARTGGRSLLPYDAQGPLYTDGNHLTVRGALALKDLFAPVVEGLLPSARQVSR